MADDTPAGGAESTPEPRDEERQALYYLAQGLTERQAATALSVSEATFRRITQRARIAVGGNSTINAVYLAAKRGLI